MGKQTVVLRESRSFEPQTNHPLEPACSIAVVWKHADA
jgi:hypothetical protein